MSLLILLSLFLILCLIVAGVKDNSPSSGNAKGYVRTIESALLNGWNKENIGHHMVRNNEVSHCEQAGIVGSLGCAFCMVYGNSVHDIHVMRWYFGYEMAGIKFHGPVDVLIDRNHVYRCNRGIWMDWMAQGTVITNNLLHDNDREKGYDQSDIYMEVNHGPSLIANNFFLSERSVLARSDGNAFVHNMTNGSVFLVPETVRETPYLKPNGTAVVGLEKTPLDDNIWLNNIFTDTIDFSPYNDKKLTTLIDGNTYLNEVIHCKKETNPLVLKTFQLAVSVIEKSDGFYLELNVDKDWAQNVQTKLVTTSLLGKTKLSDQYFTGVDGQDIEINTDYFNNKRDKNNPFPGPIEFTKSGKQIFKVWPVTNK